MIALPLGTVAELTGGRLSGGADAETLVTADVVADSRACVPGSLFVALTGEHADGHDHAAAAVAAGAVAVLAGRDVAVPAVVVRDVERALGDLARGVLGHVPGCRVVGVTGSSGKTSTKDLLAQIFERVGPTVAATASYNNEVGLPLTVLRVRRETRTLVCEYSARGPGHIHYLTTIARPDVACVLNVGAAHLGEFGSRDAIATAKGELVEALEPAGRAVLNADDRLVAAMAERTSAPVTTFGAGADADVRIVDLALDAEARPSFRLVAAAGAADVSLQLHGEHHAWNAAAATAVALAAGVDLEVVVAALRAAAPRSAHRMAVATRADGLVVVDDAYNANPESMRAAIDAVVRLAGDRRSYAVLGEMRELGGEASRLHREVGEYAARAGVDELIGVGPVDDLVTGARSASGWGGQARLVPDADAAIAVLQAELTGADVVLVKASNSIRLWSVADQLMAGAPAEARS